MEWSITKSTWQRGLIRLGSPPNSCIAVLIAARSTTAGTPVKSCKSTRAGLNGISTSYSEVVFQLRMVSTSAAILLLKIKKEYLRTLHVKIVAVAHGSLQKHTDWVGKSGKTFIFEVLQVVEGVVLSTNQINVLICMMFGLSCDVKLLLEVFKRILGRLHLL